MRLIEDNIIAPSRLKKWYIEAEQYLLANALKIEVKK